MKILQLCKKFPYPLNDGESIAVSSLSKALNQLDCQLSLLAMNTSKHFFDLDQLPKNYKQYQEIQTVPLDNKVSKKGALLNLFKPDSYHISRFESEDYKTKLKALLTKGNFDLVILETLYLTPYIETIRAHSKALICYRSHNIESEIWTRIYKNTSKLPKRVYLRYLTRKLRKYELAHLNDYDLMATVTQRDLEEFRKMGYTMPGLASPIGIDIEDYPLLPLHAHNHIAFIGSLDWVPNIEGLLWFVKDILPEINIAFPEIQLHIAGRNGSKEINDLDSPHIKIHGEVDSAISFISAHNIMIVPLLSGSGMRVKILEGLALGRIIITTTIGLEGIPAEHGVHLFIADTAAEFLSCLKEIKSKPELMSTMSQSARNFVISNYDALSNAKVFLNRIKSELKENAGK